MLNRHYMDLVLKMKFWCVLVCLVLSGCHEFHGYTVWVLATTVPCAGGGGVRTIRWEVKSEAGFSGFVWGVSTPPPSFHRLVQTQRPCVSALLGLF